MKNFNWGGRELSIRQCDDVIKLTSYQDLSTRPKEENYKYRLLLPLGRYSRSKFGTLRSHVLLTIFCVLFSGYLVFPASGQENNALTQMKQLKIGDTIPQKLWRTPLQAVRYPDGKQRITLNDYRDKKLVILGFWATWCGSCTSAWPKISVLQEKFNEDVQFLLINATQTKDSKERIDRTITQQQPAANLLFLHRDSIFQYVYPHKILPHYVWLDGNGKLLATSSSKEITEKNIRAVLNGDLSAFHLKEDNLLYDKKKALLEQMGIIDTKSIKSSSLLTGYLTGLGSVYGSEPYHTGERFFYVNYPIKFLYQEAFNTALAGVHPNEFVFDDGVDKSFIDFIASTDYDALYSYELIIESATRDRAMEYLRRDLMQQFNVSVRRDIRNTEVLVLTGDKQSNAPKTSAKGTTLGYLARQLSTMTGRLVEADGNAAQHVVAPLELENLAGSDLLQLQRVLKKHGIRSEIKNLPRAHAVFYNTVHAASGKVVESIN
ncbi:TlpA family protein disulfide reductase [Sphingobacterium paucimobilis]|uniref:Thioredoxin domain-containing protein n=1 Tax=Sphingobacterium paucimobilis HER1398 TaxID=1346330 RepID=U2J2T3_9SPHI|nr:TlpA disulfide reductase family protein [Sphingobacterium paucimobilis]ERJ59279.1 hypothetical protein M472_10885 [Sphingobacterium paucimobilis HER1398]